MNIIILAAGKGQRFIEGGYKEIKPFIKVNDKSMWQKVLENINITKDVYFHVVFNTNDMKRIFARDIKMDDNHHFHFVSSSYNGCLGSASALMNIKEYLINEEETLIVNCDQLVEIGGIERAVETFRKNQSDAGVICYYDCGMLRGSHVNINDIGQINYFVEKENKDNLGNLLNVMDVGIIYWRQGKDLVKYIEMMMTDNLEKVNGEWCHGPALNYAIEESKVILPYIVNEFWNIGTPEGLENYLSLNNGE